MIEPVHRAREPETRLGVNHEATQLLTHTLTPASASHTTNTPLHRTSTSEPIVTTQHARQV
ncbi:hypothetical protein BO85DRAFT_444368 [Aspergillus piperis CBS 112811]|uniref:Uncharacterized protein n=1 Tax=Aspergillus piperis CBS 112811 TaxID=1448313 RepID=A0A8G1VUN7_9EURO|nr:hypothetical protein BO85DRAFT_444368 [Aspergillus piperis CBS 112811]RAH63023.1 hypothetical protein BO85DRAFT_444368 [Aspergillus piperis CBS 112811]